MLFMKYFSNSSSSCLLSHSSQKSVPENKSAVCLSAHLSCFFLQENTANEQIWYLSTYEQIWFFSARCRPGTNFHVDLTRRLFYLVRVILSPWAIFWSSTPMQRALDKQRKWLWWVREAKDTEDGDNWATYLSPKIELWCHWHQSNAVLPPNVLSWCSQAYTLVEECIGVMCSIIALASCLDAVRRTHLWRNLRTEPNCCNQQIRGGFCDRHYRFYSKLSKKWRW